jgi:hypothetical protein
MSRESRPLVGNPLARAALWLTLGARSSIWIQKPVPGPVALALVIVAGLVMRLARHIPPAGR